MEQLRPIELYIHIPFCMQKCAYCDFLSAPADEQTKNRYIGALLREIRMHEAELGRRRVATIYIGGGTPSVLAPEYIELIVKQLRISFDVMENAEITIECNPGTLDERKLLAYRSVGINRLSLGLQSTFDEELKVLGRIHTYETFLHNYELARKCGFHNINVDLMSALPYQNCEKFLKSLERMVQLKPEHISAYSLIIEKGTAFYERYKFDAVRRDAGQATEVLPSEEVEYQIYKKTQRYLKEHGYTHYEISNYARPGYESRHNSGYWKRTEYLGIGLGAASLLDNVRYTNEQDLKAYMEKTKQVSTDELYAAVEKIERRAQMEEFMFLGLRMMQGITRAEFRDTFGVEIEAVYGEVLRRLKEEGLLELQAGRIYLTEKGTDISNYTLSEFLLD